MNFPQKDFGKKELKKSGIKIRYLYKYTLWKVGFRGYSRWGGAVTARGGVGHARCLDTPLEPALTPTTLMCPHLTPQKLHCETRMQLQPGVSTTFPENYESTPFLGGWQAPLSNVYTGISYQENFVD